MCISGRSVQGGFGTGISHPHSLRCCSLVKLSHSGVPAAMSVRPSCLLMPVEKDDDGSRRRKDWSSCKFVT